MLKKTVMKRLSCLLTILLLLSVKAAYCQRIISGRISGSSAVNSISYLNPIRKYNNNLFDIKNVAVDKNNRFEIKIGSNESSFVNIYLPESMGILSIYEREKDTVTFSVSMHTKDGRTRIDHIDFSGANAEGHRLYQQFRANCNQQFIVDHFFSKKKYADIDEFIANQKYEMDSIFMEYDILERNGKIRKDFTKAVKSNITGFMLFNIFLAFEYFAKQNRYEGKGVFKNWKNAFLTNRDLFTDSNYIELRKRAYVKYDPIDENYVMASPVSLFYLSSYYEDMQHGIVPATGVPYDTAFTHVAEYPYYGYMTKSILEFRWSVDLYWTPMVNSDAKVLNDKLNAFRVQFPSSPFLPLLRKRFKEFYEPEPSPEAGNVRIINRSYKKLGDLTSDEFKNKYVFVDLWATWCTPCVEDFKYKRSIDSLLKRNNISKLYISLDDSTRHGIWKKFINEKKIYGSHFIVNDTFLNNIKAQLKLSDILIPRYLLINSKGEIVNNDLPRPNDMGKLNKAIRQAIDR